MARAEHDITGASRPLVPSVDLSGAPYVEQGPADVPAVPVTPPGRVVLLLPADAAYLSVLRTTAAALAARLDLSVDEVEDVRIAVDEAASMLLQRPAASSDDGPASSSGPASSGDGPAASAEDDTVLAASFELAPYRLVVEVSGPAQTLPERGGVAWAVLEALVGEVSAARTPGGSAIRLVHDLRRAP